MANGQGMACPATAVTHPWSGFGIDALPPVRMDRRTGSDRRPLRGGCRPEPAGRPPAAAGSGPGRDLRFRGGGSPRAASAESSPAVSGRGGSRRSLGVRRTIRPGRLRFRGGEGGLPAAGAGPGPSRGRRRVRRAAGREGFCADHGDPGARLQGVRHLPGPDMGLRPRPEALCAGTGRGASGGRAEGRGGRVRSVRGGRPPSGADQRSPVMRFPLLPDGDHMHRRLRPAGTPGPTRCPAFTAGRRSLTGPGAGRGSLRREPG